MAKQAKQRGEAAVGSLLLLDGEVVIESEEAVLLNQDPTAHAEIEVIRLAARKLNRLTLEDTVLYTSTEPCFMCAYAIRQAGVKEVVIGARLESVGGVSSNYPILSDPSITDWVSPPQITRDILRAECEAIHDQS